MLRVLIGVTSVLVVGQACLAGTLPKKYCSKPSGVYTAIKIKNNCGSELANLYAMMTNLTGGHADQGIIPKTGCDTLYAPLGYNVVVYAATPGGNPGMGNGKTRFELTFVKNAQQQAIASWDISANEGFDYGMTVIAPKNHMGPVMLVAKNVYAPGLYPNPAKTDNKCTAIQPCYSNAWNNDLAVGNTFDLYVCNRPTDKANTPGVCGCNTCHGYVCAKGSSKFCTTSGSGLYCLQPSSLQKPNQCNKNVKILCNWSGYPSGGANCPKSCPVINHYQYGSSVFGMPSSF